MGGGSADPVAVRISGKKPERLYEIVDQVKTELGGIPGTRNISDDWGMRTKKIMININTLTAQLAGVSNQDIAISLQTVLSGARIGEYREVFRESTPCHILAAPAKIHAESFSDAWILWPAKRPWRHLR